MPKTPDHKALAGTRLLDLCCFVATWVAALHTWLIDRSNDPSNRNMQAAEVGHPQRLGTDMPWDAIAPGALSATIVPHRAIHLSSATSMGGA